MELKLSKDKEHLVLENRKLVYYVLKRMCVPTDSSEYEDLFSIGTIGLMKAAIYFDKTREKKFSTYAVKCIKNEINMHFRKRENKPYYFLSLNAPLYRDDDVTLEDSLEDNDANFADNIINRELFISIVNIIMNCFCGKKRLIMLYFLGCLRQTEIAQILNCDRRYISLVLKDSFNRIRQFMNMPKQREEDVSFSVENECYQFSFIVKSIEHFRQVYERIISNKAFAEEVPNNEIFYGKENIIIKTSLAPETFLFIARLIQEMNKDDIEGKKKMKD